MPKTPETSDNREFQATIGDLRKLYGVDFAKGCADNEKIADVARRQPSVMRVIRHHETKLFEQI
jgi:hypothetical protein